MHVEAGGAFRFAICPPFIKYRHRPPAADPGPDPGAPSHRERSSSMAEEEVSKGFEVGAYICPNAKTEVTLRQARSLVFVRWPIVVEKCAACGNPHELQSSDVIHPPIYGR